MRIRTLVSRLGCLTLLLAAAGCLPSGSSPADAGSAVTYTKDVQPILAAKCSPCHAGQRQGFHDVATMYADVKMPVAASDSAEHCWDDWGVPNMNMPKTVGECSLILIDRGLMPYLLQCAQFPLLDGCVTMAERDIIAAWVAGGMPQ
jgi:hypothetical protein